MIRFLLRRRAAARALQVAALEDPAFEPERILGDAVECFNVVHRISGVDGVSVADVTVPELRGLLERDLTSIAGSWALGVPRATVVAVTNRASAGHDECVVHFRYRVREAGHELRRATYWTFRRHEGRWKAAMIETAWEGRHHLRSPLLAEPAEDPQVRDDSVLELAGEDALPDAALRSAIPEGDPATAAAFDRRFDADTVLSMVRTVARAWVAACLGAGTDLAALASPQAVELLLRPRGPGSRMIVRDLAVEEVQILSVDVGGRSPTMEVEAQLRGRRGVRTYGPYEFGLGGLSRARRFTVRWTFALEGERWRLERVAPERRRVAARRRLGP